MIFTDDGLYKKRKMSESGLYVFGCMFNGKQGLKSKSASLMWNWELTEYIVTLNML